MTLEELRASLAQREPPADLPPLVRALWLEARGDWAGAHGVAQDVKGRDGAWVHAYLHRKEGDADNAAYWYGRAKRPVCTKDLVEEWADIAKSLLSEEAPT